MGLILGSFIFVYTRFFIEKPVYQPEAVSTVKGSPNFKVVMTKKQFTFLANRYLTKLNSKELDLNFALSDDAQLTGSIKFFGHALPFRLVMDVSVMTNKNLLLKPKTVSMGNLDISAQRILELIKSQVKLPRYVTIDTKKTEIILALEQIQINKDLGVKVDSVDLGNDRITFDGYLK